MLKSKFESGFKTGNIQYFTFAVYLDAPKRILIKIMQSLGKVFIYFGLTGYANLFKFINPA